jgi:hypothetical protein
MSGTIDDDRLDRLTRDLRTGANAGANGHGDHSQLGSGFARVTSFVRTGCLPDYPVDVWPDALATYFRVAADSIGTPVDMVAVPAAPILAAAIGNRRPLRIKSGWVERPIVWTALIADVSTGKSPALKHALALVDGLQADAVDEFAMKLADYDAAAAERKGKPAGERPVLEHFFTSNATLEWFGPAARDSAGIAMVRDELLGWLKDFDAYRSGRGGDRQTWLSLWSGGAMKIDRRGAETIYAEHPVVAVAGGIQPDRLPELAKDAAADGFLSRFLLSMPAATIPGWTDSGVDTVTLHAAKDIVRALRRREYRDPTPLSDDAQALFKAFCLTNAAVLNAGNVPPVLAAAYGKLPIQASRLALVLHCCHDPYGDLSVVPVKRVRDAIDLAEYHAQHAVLAYRRLNIESPDRPVGLARRVLSAVRRAESDVVTRRDLHGLLGGHVPADDLSAALDELVERGLLESERVSTAGRPAERYRLSETHHSERTKLDE